MNQTCSLCGSPLSPDSSVTLSDFTVCPACKPAALQRLTEGAQTRPPVSLFISRVKACCIDGVLLWVINFAGLTLWLAIERPHQPRGITILEVAVVLQVLTGFVYEMILVANGGATIGKVLCGLEVRSREGRITQKQAIARYFAKVLSTLTLGYLAAISGTALHDRLAGTQVVSLRTGEPQKAATFLAIPGLVFIVPAIFLSLPLPPFTAFGFAGYHFMWFVGGHLHFH